MGGFLQIDNENPRSYAPFNEFTTTELGLDRGNSVYSMVQCSPSPYAEEYLKYSMSNGIIAKSLQMLQIKYWNT